MLTFHQSSGLVGLGMLGKKNMRSLEGGADKDVWAVVRHARVPMNDIVYHRMSSGYHDSALFYVAVDRRSSSLVLASACGDR